MQSLVDGGRPEEALWIYHELCRLLRSVQKDASPGRDTRLLFEKIRNGGRGRAQELTLDATRLPDAPVSIAAPPGVTNSPSPVEPINPTSGRKDDDPGSIAGFRIVLLSRGSGGPDDELPGLLGTGLKARGCEIFVDQQTCAGLQWAHEIERQVRAADVVVPLLSQGSVQSELLQYEVQMVRDAAHQQQGKPLLLPIYVRDPGPLPEPLGAITEPLPRITWSGPADTERIADELLQALAGAPASRSGLPPPGGPVPLDSQYYVVRPTDHEFHAAIARGESIVLVKGARQTGKTSLLARGLQQARESGCRVIRTDLQMLDPADLESAQAFFQALAAWMAEQLELDVFPQQVWNPLLGDSVNFARYVRREVLAKVDAPVVWALDEVDRLFTRGFSSQVFGLFRSWYNDRVLDPTGPWSQLTLAIAYATEVYLFIREIDQSPFNVGTRVTLHDFTLDQVSELNQRYGAPLQDRSEVERFYSLVGGHPYLVSRGLREMVAHGLTLAELVMGADREGGLFGDHLRRMIVVLARSPELCEVVRGVLCGEPCPSEECFYQLWSAGIVTGESSQDVRPRCQLYATYLKRHLP
jgi:hypothetical protein